MSVGTQKKKLLSGMSVRNAKTKLREIYEQGQSDVGFKERFDGMWVWMEVWVRLRSHNRTLDVIAHAFADTISRLNKDKLALSARIHTQREELSKRLSEIEYWKGVANGASPESLKQESAQSQAPQVAAREDESLSEADRAT